MSQPVILDRRECTALRRRLDGDPPEGDDSNVLQFLLGRIDVHLNRMDHAKEERLKGE